MTADKPLNAKQKKFCLEFRKNGGCIAEAAKSAGYSEKSASSLGSQLLKNPKVLEYIEQLRLDAQRKTIMGIIERQEKLTKIARDEKEKTFDRLAAIDMLNKMDGVYIVKVDLNVNFSVRDTLAERVNKYGR